MGSFYDWFDRLWIHFSSRAPHPQVLSPSPNLKQKLQKQLLPIKRYLPIVLATAPISAIFLSIRANHMCPSTIRLLTEYRWKPYPSRTGERVLSSTSSAIMFSQVSLLTMQRVKATRMVPTLQLLRQATILLHPPHKPLRRRL